jgi:hypothetical protein
VRRALQIVAVCAVALGVALPALAAPARRTTSPAQWIARSIAAAKSAKTVRVVATGIPSGGSTIGFDFRLVAGKGGVGTMTLGKQRIDLVRIGRFAYFRAGASFWQQYAGQAGAQLFAGRWVKMPASTSGFASFVELTDISQFFTGILGSHGKLVLGSTKTINGVRAIALVDTSRSGGGTLWVAAQGTPYPVELAPASGPGLVAFESWNKPATVSAPHNAIDFSKLKK